MVLEWTATGIAVTIATCTHVGTVNSVGKKLREGRRNLANTLALCLEDGKDFEPKDAEKIGADYNKFKVDEKDIEADNTFPKNLFPSTIAAAHRFARNSGKLYYKTTTVSQEARAKRVPFLTIQQSQDNPQNEPVNHRQHDSRGSIEYLDDIDHRSVVTVLEYEWETDDNVGDFSSLHSEASSSRFGGDNNSLRLRLRGQNWILPEPLPAVHLSPMSTFLIDFPDEPEQS